MILGEDFLCLFFCNVFSKDLNNKCCGPQGVEGIDSAVRAEIDKVFARDPTKKIVIYPAVREIAIKKGEDKLGFIFSINNINESGTFSYALSAQETTCGMQLSEADNLIALGGKKFRNFDPWRKCDG